MNVLVVASSFPSLNQPWIDTHLRQLRAQGIGFTVVSFKETVSAAERNAAGDLFEHSLFLTREPRMFARHILRSMLRSPFATGTLLLRCLARTRDIRLAFKERLKILLFSAYAQDRIDGRRFDLMHVHFDQDVLPFLAFLRLNDLPTMTTFHGLNPPGVEQMDISHRKAVYRAVDAVLVNTRFAMRQTVTFGCDDGKVRVLPQGLELHKFAFRHKAPPQAGEPLRILTVGRLHRDKGQAYAVLAALRLLRAGHRIEWCFVGSGPDKDKLQALAAKVGVGEAVRFLGELPKDKLGPLFEDAHVFVLPSTSNTKGHNIETQGVVLQEAQATGCLVVASAVGGIPECIRHGIDGLLVRERSSREICRSIELLLSNPEAWRGMQDAGLENVRTRFAADEIGRRMQALYSDAIAQARTSDPRTDATGAPAALTPGTADRPRGKRPAGPRVRG